MAPSAMDVMTYLRLRDRLPVPFLTGLGIEVPADVTI
jgi:hypothetical protein